MKKIVHLPRHQAQKTCGEHTWVDWNGTGITIGDGPGASHLDLRNYSFADFNLV
jgi:hypothetical protein